MTKRIQNRVAESRWALPVTMVYALAVWLVAGLVQEGRWLQAGCFGVSCYLMLQLNNVHALIRIYSRMVTCSLVAMNCAGCFLFPTLSGAVVQMLMTGALLIILLAYQDTKATEIIYYAFLLIGMTSAAVVHVLYLVPVLWILMIFYLQCLSLRTWLASLLGLLTPYWFYGCWLLCRSTPAFQGMPLFGQGSGPSDLAAHFTPLLETEAQLSLPLHAQLLLLLVIIATLVGSVHFIRQSSADRIRVRMCFACFIWLNVTCLALLLLQPQHFDWLIRLMMVCTAPLIGHFIALSHTRPTNIFFIVAVLATLALTIFNLFA